MAYTKQQLADLVRNYANRFGIDPSVAYFQIKRESDNFRPDVVYGPFVAPAGERGMSQFTPGTWATWGNGPHTNAYVPENAMEAWGRYMTWLLNRYRGDYTKALQGYNGGPGNVDRGTVSAAARRYASEILTLAGAAPTPAPAPEPGGGGEVTGICFEGDPCYYNDPAAGAPPAASFSSSSMTPLLIGGAALLLVLLISD